MPERSGRQSNRERQTAVVDRSDSSLASRNSAGEADQLVAAGEHLVGELLHLLDRAPSGRRSATACSRSRRANVDVCSVRASRATSSSTSASMSGGTSCWWSRTSRRRGSNPIRSARPAHERRSSTSDTHPPSQRESRGWPPAPPSPTSHPSRRGAGGSAGAGGRTPSISSRGTPARSVYPLVAGSHATPSRRAS